MRSKHNLRAFHGTPKMQTPEEPLVQPGFTTQDAGSDQQMPEQIPEEGYVDEQGMRHFPDGSKVLNEPQGGDGPSQLNVDNHDQNLADHLPDHVLSEIGNHLKQAIEEDRESQSQFFQSVADIIDLLGIKSVESIGENASTTPAVHSTALFETLLDYTATIMGSIFPTKGPVDSVILGETTPELEDIAYRKTQFFNSYLQQIDKGFDKELKRTVVWSILTGSIYSKVYIDGVLGRPTARMIKPEDFIVNRDVSSHLAATRKTQIHHMDKREFDLRKHIKEYRDVDILPTDLDTGSDNVIKEQLNEISGYDSTSSKNSNNDSYEIFESHVDYHIAKDPAVGNFDIPLPYIITLDAKSGTVLRIQRNWDKNDFLKKKREYFVNWSLLPSLDGEGYGLVQYAGTQAQAATTITRQLITAGMYSNFPGGVYQSGLRLENNTLRPMPGEFLPIQTGGVPIQQSIQALPYKEPSAALGDLKNQIEDNIRKPSAIISQKVSEMAPRAPVGTVLAMLESLQKVPNFVIQGYHKAFENMLALFNDRFFEWLPADKPYPFVVPGGSHVIIKTDFDDKIQVIPSSDPSLQNSTYRFMRSEIILNNARQGADIHDMRYANELFYKNLGLSVDDIHKLLLPPPPPPAEIPPPIPMDPITENQHLLTGKPVAAGLDQDHDAHILVHTTLHNNPIAAADPTVLAAVDAHNKQHAAMKILVDAQASLGFQMPQDPSQLPPDVQNQIAVLAAQQAQQAAAAAAGQQQAAQDPQMITAQALMDDVRVKELQANLRAEIDKLKLTLDQQRLKMEYEKMHLENNTKEKELQLKIMTAEGKQAVDEKKVDIDLLSKSQSQIHQNETMEQQ